MRLASVLFVCLCIACVFLAGCKDENTAPAVPEEVDIPIGIIARLWAGCAKPETGRLDLDATEDLLSDLFGLSLLQDLDLDRRVVRLHDTVRVTSIARAIHAA